MRFSLPPHIAWPVFVIALLVMGMVTTIYSVIVATESPPQVVENYYEKALAWNDQQAEAAASQALGWDLHFSVEAQPSAPHTIAISLMDRSGAHVTNLAGTIRARRPDQVGIHAEQALTARQDGTYEAQLPLTQTGLWDFEIVAERQNERYVQTVRREIYQ